MDKTIWKYKPNMIQIEATQGCNRRCTFCGTMGMEKKFYFADLETMEHTARLIGESELNSRILLAGHGEPTLNPNIIEIVKTIRKHLQPINMIHMFTNGTKIVKHPELIDELFEAGLNDLCVDEYTDNQVGSIIKDHVKDKYPIVTMGEKDKKGNSVKVFMDKKPNGKRVAIIPAIDDKDTNVKLSHKLCNHCGAGMEPVKEPIQKRCSVIFRDFFVRWDGNIAMCCNDFRGEYPVVNIKDCKTLQEAYFHPRLESARKYIILGNRASVYPCSICNVSPIRPGLLPDMQAKVKLELPNDEDKMIVNEKREPLSKIEKREWENNV